MAITEKRCPKCKVTKGVCFFGKNAGQKDGLQGWCKSCHNAAHVRTTCCKCGAAKPPTRHSYCSSCEAYTECNKCGAAKKPTRKNHCNNCAPLYSTCLKCGADKPTNKSSVCAKCVKIYTECKKCGSSKTPNSHRFCSECSVVHNVCRICASPKNPNKNGMCNPCSRDHAAKRRSGNRLLFRAYTHRHRSLKRSASGSYSKDEWEAILKKHRNRCAACDVRFSDEVPATVDHIIPLSRGGTNFAYNLQPLCLPCNSSKKARIASGSQHSLFDAIVEQKI
jgi:hypothetical protein